MAISERNGRKWVPVSRPAPKETLNTYGQVRVPDVPGNAHLSGLDKLQIEAAHHQGGTSLIPHVDASGAPCCKRPRKTRSV